MYGRNNAIWGAKLQLSPETDNQKRRFYPCFTHKRARKAQDLTNFILSDTKNAFLKPKETLLTGHPNWAGPSFQGYLFSFYAYAREPILYLYQEARSGASVFRGAASARRRPFSACKNRTSARELSKKRPFSGAFGCARHDWILF